MTDLEPPTRGDLAAGAWTTAQIDTTVAHPARMYDYYLGGQDHYKVDREAAEAVTAVVPEIRAGARANRAFLGRAVRFLATAGVRQFLDIGTGLPGPDNTNQVAHSIAHDARVVYVDNDPIVITHARALLAKTDAGRTTVAFADLRNPEFILGHPEVRAVLDFTEPVAVLLVAVLHFIRDSEDPPGIVEKLMAAMAPGSYLAITHATADVHPGPADRVTSLYEQASAAPLVLRSRGQVDALFSDLEYVEPGLVHVSRWRPDGAVPSDADHTSIYGGIGRKD
jgi:hypothetical protein